MSSYHKVLIKQETIETENESLLETDSVVSYSDASHHHPNIKEETCSVSKTDLDNNEDAESQFQLTSIITVEPVTVKREILPDYEDNDELPEWQINSNQNLQRRYHPEAPSICICTICNTGFPNSDLFEKHLNTAHEDIRPFPCKICKKRFQTNKRRKAHEQIHNPNRFKGEPQFGCDLCDKRYHLKQSLACHRKMAHLGYKPPPKKKKTEPRFLHRSRKGTVNPEPRLPKRPKPKKGKEKSFVCELCKKSFWRKYHLEQHVNLHLKKKTFQCQICSSTFYHPVYLKRHVKRVHNKEHLETKPDCTCKLCGTVLANPDKLKYHITLHKSKSFAFECEYCGEKFKTRQYCIEHQNNHKMKEDDKFAQMVEFKCRICGRSGMKKWQYQRHRKTAHKLIPHQGENEKPFSCGVCAKPFVQRIYAVICALAGHDAKQVKAKMFKFQCPECPPDVLGFRYTAEVQKHWEIEHPDKVIPAKFRNRMFDPEFVKPDGRVLPVYKKNKKLCEEIKKCNGPPDSSVKYDFPLWKDLDLLPFSEEQKLEKKNVKTRKRKSTRFTKQLMIDQRSVTTVNVNDTSAVRDLLGDKILTLVLKRC